MKKPEVNPRKVSGQMDQNKSMLMSVQSPTNEKQCEEHIRRCIKKILGEIDQERVLKKY